MQNDQNNYTAKEIRNYLDGKMNTAEMHALEKAAMDDAFLAEAIQGYQYDSGNLGALALQQLKQDLDRKIYGHQAKVIPMHPAKSYSWARSAVALIIVGVLAVASYFAFFNKKKSSITIPLARNEKIASPRTKNISKHLPINTNDVAKVEANPNKLTDNNPVAYSNTATEDRSIMVQDKILIPEVSKDIAVLENLKPDEGKKNIETPQATIVDFSEKNNNLALAKVLDQQKSQAAEPFLNRKSAAHNTGYTEEVDISELNKMFIAQVVGSDNMPLAFANINVKSDKFGTYADAKGNFRLISSDSVVEVEIKSVGYQTKNILLKSAPALKKIILEENKMAMQNVAGGVISTASTRQQQKGRFVKDSAENVEPADGWASYEAYVDNNIQVPEIVNDRNIKGMVELSFDVRKNGSISNAKVDKSLCEDCDEEALRLIKQGPQWKVMKGRKGKSKVKVRF